MMPASGLEYRWRLGEIEITRVLEFEAALFEPTVIHPELTPEMVERRVKRLPRKFAAVHESGSGPSRTLRRDAQWDCFRGESGRTPIRSPRSGCDPNRTSEDQDVLKQRGSN